LQKKLACNNFYCIPKPSEPPGPSKPVPQSAFRAVSSMDQPYEMGTIPLIRFDMPVFDLNNEYFPTLSTFIPKQGGVYLIEATVFFSADGNADNITAIFISLDGGNLNTALNAANNFIPGTALNVVTVSTIARLNAGDTVQVFGISSAAGSFIAGSIFSAARFPSPPEATLMSQTTASGIPVSDLAKKILGSTK